MIEIKCLYLTQQPLIKNDGASEKVIAQTRAIESLGIDTKLAHIFQTDEGWRLLIGDEIIAVVQNYKLLYHHILSYIEREQISLLYMRYGASASFVYNKFLGRVAKFGVRIFLEIPTYPYDGERSFSSLKVTLKIFLERYLRNRWKGIVYRIVTYSADKQIYGIPTINISNAPARVLPIKRTLHINTRINMIAVANLAFWHGYDRLIRGMAQFYKVDPKIKVYFTIVGVGNKEVFNELKALTEELGLNEFVNFLGSKSSIELDSYFDDSHLAIGCLGCHRKNIVEVKSLKNVEYAMRGIPMVYSENNTDFDNRPYVFKVPADDSDIDVSALCNFVMSCNSFPLDIHNSVVDMTWEKQMEKVFRDYILKI